MEVWLHECGFEFVGDPGASAGQCDVWLRESFATGHCHQSHRLLTLSIILGLGKPPMAVSGGPVQKTIAI